MTVGNNHHKEVMCVATLAQIRSGCNRKDFRKVGRPTCIGETPAAQTLLPRSASDLVPQTLLNLRNRCRDNIALSQLRSLSSVCSESSSVATWQEIMNEALIGLASTLHRTTSAKMDLLEISTFWKSISTLTCDVTRTYWQVRTLKLLQFNQFAVTCVIRLRGLYQQRRKSKTQRSSLSIRLAVAPLL